MRISDWSSDVCSSDLLDERYIDDATAALLADDFGERRIEQILVNKKIRAASFRNQVLDAYDSTCAVTGLRIINRSEEHTSELQSLMRISYAVFCLTKKKNSNVTIFYHIYTHQHLHSI